MAIKAKPAAKDNHLRVVPDLVGRGLIMASFSLNKNSLSTIFGRFFIIETNILTFSSSFKLMSSSLRIPVLYSNSKIIKGELSREEFKKERFLFVTPQIYIGIFLKERETILGSEFL